MSSDLPPAARGLLVIVLAVGVLAFGAMGLCGGYFTIGFLPELLEGHVNVATLLLLSLPCLIGGCVMVGVCARKIWALLQASNPDRDSA